MQSDQSTGYVLRDENGSLYLIREDVLEACRIEGADLDYARQFEREGRGEAFEINEGPFAAYSRIDDSCATHPFDVCEARPEPSATMMCAW